MVSAVTFTEARAAVLRQVQVSAGTETVPLLEAMGRVLAEEVRADRDYPAAARSTRDGFAVRVADLPGPLRIAGETRAGENAAKIGPGECQEIMTGAPMPEGADAVVMVEHATVAEGCMLTERRLHTGENWVPAGCDARVSALVLAPGRRIGAAQIAMAATVGRTELKVYRRPRVAILATGDEVVPIEATPGPAEVRNSNSYSIAAQVARAGGEPVILPVAKDTLEATRAGIAAGLEADLLLLSGGVSAGKYDLVETVLAEFGAEFFFTRVKIQPGQPLVFGKAGERFFFGLPGNPASTMVTFAMIARAAVERLGGVAAPELPLLWATLDDELRVKPGLTRFLPAEIHGDRVRPVRWSGSGDVPALARANGYLVTDPDRDAYLAGEAIAVVVAE